MNYKWLIPQLFAAGALAACSSTSTPTTIVPAVEGSAQNAGGSYSVTQPIEITGTPAVTGDGFLAWGGGVGNSHKGYAYESADVVAIAAMDVSTDVTVAGISGTAATNVPTSGTGVYAGGFSGTYLRGGGTNAPWNVRGAFTTNVDFATGAVTGSGTGSGSSTLSVTGTASGAQFNGTATFTALEYGGSITAPLTGGLYGTNTLAGIYQGPEVTGIIWGVSP